MKYAFVLSGGGAKGAFQVGAMKALAEKGIVPKTIYGTSVGALNSAGYAYKGLTELENIWLNIGKRRHILRSQWYKLLWSDGYYSTKPLQKLLEKHITGQPNIESVVTFVNFKNGSLNYRSSKNHSAKNFTKYILASGSIPAVMEPVDKYLVDGGVREVTPLKRAIEDGYRDIVVILCSPNRDYLLDNWKPSFPKIISYAMRAVEVMNHEVALNDIKNCEKYNREGVGDKVNLKLIGPDRNLHDALDFNPVKIRQALKLGQEIVAKSAQF